MFKKVIAGIVSVTLALGMVALTATPASAHTPTVDATCTSLHVKLTQYSSGDTNHLTITIDGAVPAAVDIADFGQSYEQTFPFTPGAASHSYSVVIDVSGGTQYDKTFSGTVNDCLPDDTSKKVEICHWNSSNDYTYNNISVSAVINVPNGHVFHPNDIIPPFSYVKQGVAGNFAGLNWNALGQSRWNNDCDDPEVIATKPVFTDGVCIAAFQRGAGSYQIPAITGVQYWQKFSSGGTYVTVGAGLYPLAIGEDVYIKATELPGFELAGNDNNYSWHEEIGGPAADSKCVVPATPTFNGQVCTGPGTKSQASYTVPSTANVQYQRSINDGPWTNISAQTVLVNSFSVKIEIRAVVNSPYVVVPGSFLDWTFDFVSAGDCYGTPQVPQASYTDGFCYSAGTPTGPTVTVFAASGIASFQLSVNGGAFVAFPGTVGSAYTLPVGTTSVQVRPIAAANYLAAADLPVHNFVSPGDCILPATPAADAIEPECVYEDKEELALGPSYVRLYWNAGIASYFIEGYGSVSRPASDPYTDVDTGNPLDELTITPTAFFGYSLTVPDVTVTFAAKIINQCGDGLIGDPTHNDEVCDDGEGVGGWIWVERMEGLKYTISGGTLGAPIVIEGVGTGPYLDGTVALDAGTYTVSTEALPGYVLTPHPDNLPVDITIDEPEESCIVSVELACLLNDGGILLPEIAHLVWTVDVPSDGNPPLYVEEPGPLFIPITIAAVHITASLVGTGYAFPDGLQTGWAFQLEQRQLECGELTTLAPIPTNVTWTQAHCVDGKVVGATVTVGNVDGEDWFPEVNYYLDGSETPLATRTTAVSAGAHFVDAETVDPDDSIEEGSLDFWEFNIAAAPGSCDLTTLALTGLGSNPFGWAGIGYYLLVTGLALIAVRTMRRRNEVKQ